MNRIVNLEYLDNYKIDNVQKSIENSFSKLDLSSIFAGKKKVMLKVCLPKSCSPDEAETTHPSVVRAVVNVLSKLGVKCVVVDSPYGKFGLDHLDEVYVNTGMLEVANLTTCELNRNLNTNFIQLPNGIKTKRLHVLDVINEVDAIINIGKIKIDDTLGYCGALTNLLGIMPGDVKTININRLITLKDFYQFNLDVYNAVEDKLILNIIDGVVALEAGNTQRLLSCIGVCEDIFSLDACILDILGIDLKNTIINQAEEQGLFDTSKSYRLLGKDIKDFKVEDFALSDFDANSKIHETDSQRKKLYKQNQQRVVIPQNKCKGCGICSKICPTNAITMKYDKNNELYAVVDYNKCILCYKCVTGCPYKVVELHKPLNYKKLEKEINKYKK